MPKSAQDPEGLPVSGVRRQDDDELTRLRARFLAVYSGSWNPQDAFDWSRNPEADSSAGSPAPAPRLRAQRDRLYQPGTSGDEVRRFEERQREFERELTIARDALTRAFIEPASPPVSRSGTGSMARHRRAALLALLTAGLATAVGTSVALGVSQRARQSPQPVPETHHLNAIPLHLVGSAQQIAALRVAINGDSEGPGALVTATALRDVPVLRSARAISESDLTATGHGVITIPDLDEFSPQRHATVLVFCQRATAYDWAMTASANGAGSRTLYSAVGHDANCSGLSYITVPLPEGVRRFTVSARVGDAVRFLIEVQSTG